MKKKVAETRFAVHYIDEENNLLEQLWTNEDRKMTDNDYQKEMLHYLEFVEKYKTRSALINTKNFAYIITPDMQEWVDQNIAIKANRIVTRIAFVLPYDIFDKVSIEQTMQESEGRNYREIKYFENRNDAMDWLMNE